MSKELQKLLEEKKQEKGQALWNEIRALCEKHEMELRPALKVTNQGIFAVIEIVELPKKQ